MELPNGFETRTPGAEIQHPNICSKLLKKISDLHE